MYLYVFLNRFWTFWNYLCWFSLRLVRKTNLPKSRLIGKTGAWKLIFIKTSHRAKNNLFWKYFITTIIGSGHRFTIYKSKVPLSFSDAQNRCALKKLRLAHKDDMTHHDHLLVKLTDFEIYFGFLSKLKNEWSKIEQFWSSWTKSQL